jgi:[pyruvate, water dikinase]-phosphate phosphotransferase / [pyruvate, water dikinase] kinase
MRPKRSAFFVSDGTGITAEMLGHSLLTQFDGFDFDEFTVPYVDSPERAQATVDRINQRGREDGARPLVFSTLVHSSLSAIIAQAEGLVLDCFELFMLPMERELGVPAAHMSGRSHSARDFANYHRRIEALNYSLSHDDGREMRDFRDADVILVGVSRCGKTPTCLYLAMQFGVRAANVPFVDEDLNNFRLPAQLQGLKRKLYGLTIDPERLQEIRRARLPGTSYSQLSNCQFEVREAEALMMQEHIPYLDVTSKSVEELATTILQEARLTRRVH